MLFGNVLVIVVKYVKNLLKVLIVERSRVVVCILNLLDSKVKKSCIDLKGQRFGKLLVLKKSNNRCHTGVKWICQCDCGNIVEVASQSLLRGRTKSCGCIRYSIGE